MISKRKHFLVVLLLTIVTGSQAQVARKVVTEHFTNTRCSICASRNPALFTNLRNNPNVIHIAYHPSSPYSACVLNRHNVSENDDRTRYYGVYGGTPRIAIQGKAQSASVNFSSSSIFTNEQGKTTPISIGIHTLQKGNDSLTARLVLKAEAAHSLSDMHLYAIAVEDTVFYNAPNGEKEHFDVFRKVLLDMDVTLPKTAGDSVEYVVRTANHMDWEATRMYVAAMLQHNSSKEIEQVETSKDADKIVLSAPAYSARDLNSAFEVFPNPGHGHITLRSEETGTLNFSLINALGQVVQSGDFVNSTNVNVQELPAESYIIRLSSSSGVQYKRLQIVH